jgi:hypothetical protein
MRTSGCCPKQALLTKFLTVSDMDLRADSRFSESALIFRTGLNNILIFLTDFGMPWSFTSLKLILLKREVAVRLFCMFLVM